MGTKFVVPQSSVHWPVIDDLIVKMKEYAIDTAVSDSLLLVFRPLHNCFRVFR